MIIAENILLETPDRVACFYKEIFSGLNKPSHTYLETSFTDDHEELVLVKDISFFSVCEHHLVSFFGQAHVAYIPKEGEFTGLSKLARTVEAVAQKPQLQERMTYTIANNIMSVLQPHGVMVILEAEHLCMAMRGVKKPGAVTVTSAVRGHFAQELAARQEVLELIRHHK
ncbi:GTP cyclohydrolase I FolE [uncultured Marinococcus sp.]|uniref:GTP cyclohydrolase I FolE n=1 Tax=uncultured Marinococcus sp. TaxID=487012 RepID=UPI0026146731|nr:GTP cyclohydrolase I FolE [uncultured Marinococcus sp.]